MKDQSNRPIVSFEQLSHSNMLTINAVIERLSEMGEVTPFTSPL